jgi:hypothetical protein
MVARKPRRRSFLQTTLAGLSIIELFFLAWAGHGAAWPERCGHKMECIAQKVDDSERARSWYLILTPASTITRIGGLWERAVTLRERRRGPSQGVYPRDDRIDRSPYMSIAVKSRPVYRASFSTGEYRRLTPRFLPVSWVTVFKAWIPWERSLRFKCSATSGASTVGAHPHRD